MKTLKITLASIFAASALTACGGTNAPILDAQMLQQPQQVQTNSFSGVKKEIETISKASFKALDGNRDKFITPDEYGVNSAETFSAFRQIDNNKDGKISEKEFTPGFFSKLGLTLRLQKTANNLFKQLDRSRDGYLTPQELDTGIVSTEFNSLFTKYDKEKKGWFSRKSTKGKLSKSEFQNLFAHIALTSANSGGSAPAPAPDPAPPADAPPADAPPAM